jgi:hypothetical protein
MNGESVTVMCQLPSTYLTTVSQLTENSQMEDDRRRRREEQRIARDERALARSRPAQRVISISSRRRNKGPPPPPPSPPRATPPSPPPGSGMRHRRKRREPPSPPQVDQEFDFQPIRARHIINPAGDSDMEDDINPADNNNNNNNNNNAVTHEQRMLEQYGTAWREPIQYKARRDLGTFMVAYDLLEGHELGWMPEDFGKTLDVMVALLKNEPVNRIYRYYIDRTRYMYEERVKLMQQMPQTIHMNRQELLLEAQNFFSQPQNSINYGQLSVFIRLRLEANIATGEPEQWLTVSVPPNVSLPTLPVIPSFDTAGQFQYTVAHYSDEQIQTAVGQYIYEEMMRWKTLGAVDSGVTELSPINRIEYHVIRLEATPEVGGCAKKHSKNSNINGILVRSHPSELNECLIACVVRALNFKNPNKVFNHKFRQHLHSYHPDLSYSLKVDGNGYRLDAINPLAEFFQVDITVYDCDGEVLQEGFASYVDENTPPPIDLLLHNEHFYEIKSMVAVGKKCEKCKRVFMKEHICTYQRCDHCFKWYKLKHHCQPTNIQFLDKQSEHKKGRTRLYTSTKFYKEKFDVTDNIVIFDMETFVDEATGAHTAYAVGWYDCKSEEYHCSWGVDCVGEFHEWLISRTEQEKDRIILVGFNNSGFDNHLLLDDYVRHGESMEGLDFILSSGRIIQLVTPHYKAFDIYQFLPGYSLASAAKSFRAPIDMQKGDFPHKFITGWDDLDYVGDKPPIEYYWDPPDVFEPVLDTWNLKDECLKYLEKDVMATLFVYTVVAEMMRDKFEVKLTDYITLSQCGFAIWTSMIAPYHEKRDPSNPTKKAPPPYHPWGHKKMSFFVEIPSPDKYEFIYQAIVGGRVYPLKKAFVSQHYDEIKEGTMKYEELESDYILDLDCVSLYPFAMAQYEYPTGPSHWVTELNALAAEEQKLYELGLQAQAALPNIPEYLPHKLGVWQVEYIPNKSLCVPILARKEFKKGRVEHQLKSGGLQWDLLGDEDDPAVGIYTSAELITAIAYGYKIKLIKGLQWDTRAYIFKEYIDRMFEVKKEGEDTRNPVLRQMGKNLMNSNYGKQLQQPIIDKTNLILSKKQFDEFTFKYRLSDMVFLPNHPSTVILKGYEQDLVGSINKPAQYGAFVLSYSRRIMERYITICDPARVEDSHLSVMRSQHYGDTDSIHTKIWSKQHYEEIDPYIQEGSLGKLANDFKDHKEKIIRAYYLEPKTYCLVTIGDDNVIRTHIKCKGIRNKLLSIEDFERAANGETGIIKEVVVIRRTGATHTTIRTPSVIKPDEYTETELEPFTLYSVKLKKKFYKQPWEGRKFLGLNSSVPFGHVYDQD